MADTGTTTKRSGNSWAPLVIYLALFAALPIVIASLPNHSAAGRLRHRVWRAATFMFPDNASGTITSSGNGGNWTMNVDTCYSGERRGYFGIMFGEYDNDDLAGHISMQEGIEPRLVVNKPGSDHSMVYERHTCSVWDVDMHHTSSTYNKIWNMTGHAKFDCEWPGAEESHVTGDLKLRSCH